MAREVRLISAEETAPWVEQMGVGFHFRPAPGWAKFFFDGVDLGRTWGAFDGESVVGTLRSFATDLTTPGGMQVPAAALTNVTVAPTHRRSGLLTEMITSDLAQSAALGEAVGILIASEWPIYGRFGYGAAVESAKYEIDPSLVRFREPSIGAVELVDDAALRKVAPVVYEEHRKAQPGAIERRPAWWDRHLFQVEVPGERPGEHRNALYRSPEGEIEGYVRYKVSSEWHDMRPASKLTTGELFAVTSDAHRGLWGYCTGVDLVMTLEVGDRPVDEVLPFRVIDGRAIRQTARYDFVWVRVLDVPQTLAGRRYTTEGRIVIEVADKLGHAAGRYALEGGPDGAECKRTDESAQISLEVDALGSVYLGGFSFAALVAAGRVTPIDERAVATADAMFLTARKPWCATWF
jgi:predicted acetyltransferase